MKSFKTQQLQLYLLMLIQVVINAPQAIEAQESAIKFNQDTSSYSALTFTFDPRLDKQGLEWLHFEHWLSIMQQSSALLYDSLNGRAHFDEIRVLIPLQVALLRVAGDAQAGHSHNKQSSFALQGFGRCRWLRR